MISLESHVVRNDDFLWRMLDDEAFIINPDGEKIHMLNKTGSFIWKLFEENISIGAIIKRLCERFDVEEQTARSDTLALIEEMLNKKIITLSDTVREA